MGRFINADAFAATGQGLLGNNMYAYCNNAPVSNQDSSGNAVETVFDIISLGASIADVVVNPADPWAWIGLVGDIADVAIPCVGGLGEAVRALKTVDAIDNSVDIVKITQNTLTAISDSAHALTAGSQFVYTADIPTQPGVLEYVGITNNFDRRRIEWNGTRDIYMFISDIDRDTARLAEQTVITLFGRGGKNTLSNIRNSIGVHGRLYDDYLNFLRKFLY